MSSAVKLQDSYELAVIILVLDERVSDKVEDWGLILQCFSDFEMLDITQCHLGNGGACGSCASLPYL